MIDKQIIIDGVDVSGCEYLDNVEYDELCLMISDRNECQVNCLNKPNCYYKQLKRKEQEYEELRQYHNKCCEEFENEKQKLIDKYNQFSKDFFIGKYCKKEYCELLKAKEQECEKLNEHSVGFARKCQKLELDVFHLKDKNYNLQRQLDQLKAEKESLKESLKMFSSTLDWALKSQVGLYKRQIDSSVPDDWEYEEVLVLVEQYIEKLKQTITEIKEIAEADFNHTCWETYARQLKQILQKISECEV